MKFSNLQNRLNIVNFDSISKFNLCKKKELNFFSIKKLKLLSLIDGSDKLFYKKILVLFKISSGWFNKKLYVYRIINKKNMRKNNILYQFGCTITNTTDITCIVDYINNIIYPVSLRIDNNLKIVYFNKYIIYKFNNLNYLLGFDNSSYFNIKMDYNIVIVYKIKKFTTNKQYNLKKFYEKIFFL